MPNTRPFTFVLRILVLRAPIFALIFGFLLSSSGWSQNKVPTVPQSLNPTPTNLSIEWPLGPDGDPDAVVSLRYRRAGTDQDRGDWKRGMDLFYVPADTLCGHDWKARYSGSIFGLAPSTEYEIELQRRSSADNNETSVQTLTATTRAWPVSPTQGKPVDPKTIDQAIKQLSAGDVLVLADGNYTSITVHNDGTGDSPIVIRAQNPGGAVFDGDVRMDGRQNVHVVGLTVNGKIKFNNGHDIVVRECTVNTLRDGIVCYGQESRGAVIVGNTVTGATNWNEPALGAEGDNIGEGIVVTGSGHVIAFNRISKFRDGISLTEDKGAFNQQAIDIFRNEIDTCADDGIEADFAMGNVRVYENRLTNCFMGISSQPSLGGPTYFIRNAMFNIVLSPFKLQRSSIGDVVLHNTAIKSGCGCGVFTHDRWQRAYFRNNLFLGGFEGEYNGYDTGDGRAVYLPTASESCDFDYNGYGNYPDKDIRGRVGDTTFESEQEMRVHTERHSFAIQIDEFKSVSKFPADPLQIYAAQTLTLNSNAKAKDRGLLIPGINEDFQGIGPDLGAYEVDQPTPSYGPEALKEWLSASGIK